MIPIIVAILAPIVSCISLLPQLWKIWKTKSVKDLSFVTILLFVTGSSLWLAHGYFINDLSVLVSSMICLVINISILGLYLKHCK